MIYSHVLVFSIVTIVLFFAMLARDIWHHHHMLSHEKKHNADSVQLFSEGASVSGDTPGPESEPKAAVRRTSIMDLFNKLPRSNESDDSLGSSHSGSTDRNSSSFTGM